MKRCIKAECSNFLSKAKIMKVVERMKMNEIISFAKKHGYDGAEPLGKWKSYDVYEPTFDISISFPLTKSSFYQDLFQSEALQPFLPMFQD